MTWRRSAVSCGFGYRCGAAVVGVGVRLSTPSSAMARSILRRCPSGDAKSFRSWSVRSGRTERVDVVLGKALRVLRDMPSFSSQSDNLLRRWRAHDANSSSNALASFRSSVSKPSVNQP